jgi:hypothetical protein
MANPIDPKKRRFALLFGAADWLRYAYRKQ